jgi:uncharacterized protein (TIRG00374 family)
MPTAPGLGVAPRPHKGQVVKAVLGLIVGLVILGLWLYWIGIEGIVAALKTVAPVPALVATLAWVVSMGLRSWKWHILLPSTQRVSFGVSGRVYWVCAFMNLLLPFRVGELARSLLLKQLVDLPVSASLPTVLVDRLYSIAAILLGLVLIPLLPFQVSTSAGAPGLGMQSIRWGIGIVAAAFLITLLGLYLLCSHKAHMLRFGRRVLFMLPDRWTDRILGFVDTMVDSIRFVRADPDDRAGRGLWTGAWSALGLLAWSVAVLFADAIKDQFVLRAFGLNVPLLTCVMGVCLTNLAFVLPSPPGNIGSNQWYATLVYSSGFGYDLSRVAGGALFGHAMTTLVVAAGGALSLSGLGINLAESLRISQGDLLPESLPKQEQEL